MKPVNQEKTILATNISDGKDFGMKASAKAFKILSSTIYENKIAAVIRELSCNAYDSHVEAGKGDMPFKVHLPTRLEPFFSVQDFGTGLSEEQVMNVFTTYFASTKTESNDVIGAMGLGSKSPFSYTDQFTVVSVYDFSETTYLCFISDSGAPRVSIIGSRAVEECNGVTVIVEVSERDIAQFEDEAKKIFKWFAVVPEINTITVESLNVGDGDLIITPDPGGYDFVALMGNVAYKVSSSLINNTILYQFRQNSGFALRFDIGELDVAASRETLSLDDVTLANLTKKVSDVCDTLVGKIQGQIDSLDSIMKIYDLDSFKFILGNPELFTFEGVPVELYYVHLDHCDITFADDVKLASRKGRSNVRLSTRGVGTVWTLYGKPKYTILVEDQKRHAVYVRKELFNRTTGQMIVVEKDSSMELVKGYLEEIGVPVRVERVSSMVAGGCKPASASNSGSRSYTGHTVNMKVVNNNVTTVRPAKMSRGEIKQTVEEYLSEGTPVFVEGVDFTSHYNYPGVDTLLAQVATDGTVVLQMNRSNALWAMEKLGIPDMKNMVISDDVLAKVTACAKVTYCRDIVNYSLPVGFEVFDGFYTKDVAIEDTMKEVISIVESMPADSSHRMAELGIDSVMTAWLDGIGNGYNRDMFVNYYHRCTEEAVNAFPLLSWYHFEGELDEDQLIYINAKKAFLLQKSEEIAA